MTVERWQQVKDLLQKALELAPEERNAFLDQSCSSDHSLRREVENLLNSSKECVLISCAPPARQQFSVKERSWATMRFRRYSAQVVWEKSFARVISGWAET